jgi:phosphatidate phosphatase APP1
VGNGSELTVEAVLPADDSRQFAVKLHVPPRQVPLLVVSDVDDTVRVADVLNRPRMIERVFLQAYEPVPGMSEIYMQLGQRGGEFHFVSGSPWQISGLIERLLSDEGFPPATLHCRQLNWDFWNSDSMHTKEFKIASINTLLKQFRDSRVLLIGDDGEHDPEVYSEICRAHPDRVAGIWIRQLNPQSSGDRLAQAKVQLGVDRVVTFRDATQLGRALDLIRSRQ